MEEALIVLAALVFLLLPLVTFGLTLGARSRLSTVEQTLSDLRRRLDDLAARGPTPAAATAIAPPPPPRQAEPLPPTAAQPEPPREPIPTDVSEPLPEAASTAPVEPPVAPEPPPVPTREPDYAGFEERFGTRWVVWVGGLALALGGIFLVRYSIEQGLLGPGVRVFLGGLLAAALVAAGEWARRKEILSGVAGLPTAHIPSIVTAAGTTVAYATVYAAYALYDFLAPGSAFILLGIVALVTLAASLLHGPALAGLGLVGAYVTPLLVSTDKPSFWALYIYMAVVTVAAFALARMRLWLWLALAAVGFSALWLLAGLGGPHSGALVPASVFAIVCFALAAAMIVAGLFYGPDAEPGRIDAVSCAALAAYLVGVFLLTITSRHDLVPLWTFTVLATAGVAIAWRTEAATAFVPIAGALAALVLWNWAVEFRIDPTIAPGGPVAGTVPEPGSAAISLHLTIGALYAALFGLTGFLAQGRSAHAPIPIIWAATSALVPIAVLIALYYRIAGFERSIPFAGLALLLAALYGVVTEFLGKREPRPGGAAAGAVYATATLGSLALALTFALEKGWLTIALALMVPGIAWIAEKRPLPMLRTLAAVFVAIVLARIAWEPRIVGADVGTTPILNWLLYGYGVPAAAFWFAGSLLRRRADDVPTRTTESAAILFTVLLVVWEIRHLINGGDVYRHTTTLAEIGLDVCVGLAMALGLEWVRQRSRSIVHDIGALVIAGLTLVAIVFGLGVLHNPMVTGDPIGGRFLNLILLGYGLPAILAAALGLYVRGHRPQLYRTIAAITAVALALAYLSLQVRTLYHGPVLTIGPTTDAEQYTYSAVWLAFGVVLLLIGIMLGSQPVRLASAAVVLLTVGKVFLYDLAGVRGVYRALSFICLGLVLMGIGLVYQRLLFPRRPRPTAEAPPS